MWRSVASNAANFLMVALFLMAGIIIWGKAQYTSPGPAAQAFCLQVERGSNWRRVSESLEKIDAVTDGKIFRLGADYAGKSDQLKAGNFLVEVNASMESIVEIITRSGASTCGVEVVFRVGVNRIMVQVREMDPANNRFVERAEFELAAKDQPEIYTTVKSEGDTRYRIAFAEGVTSWQVVYALRSLDFLSGEILEIPPEGALAPDSYEMQLGDKRSDILEAMIEKQELWVSAAWAARNPLVPLESPEELLTLASIIEKETGVAEELGKVASVFINRLNRGMRLQTDPTVIYGITKGQAVLGRGLKRSELDAVTPWNTYLINGLPPTPIANPGRASLMAAGQPDETNFVYFVADGTGGHAFAETLDEHNRNVAIWRKIEAEKTIDN